VIPSQQACHRQQAQRQRHGPDKEPRDTPPQRSRACRRVCFRGLMRSVQFPIPADVHVAKSDLPSGMVLVLHPSWRAGCVSFPVCDLWTGDLVFAERNERGRKKGRVPVCVRVCPTENG
jgi:hypothetical protein